ncbi:MAG TPA: hypothetical protein VIG29_14350, partial [Vicinamibacteria bacterium]
RSMAEDQEHESGQRVRLTTTAGERLTGHVSHASSDPLVIELEDGSGSRSLARSDLASVETVRARSRAGGAWHNAKWGALLGAASGTTLGFWHEQVGEDGASVGEAVALGVWSGFVMGGLIGATVGALSPGHEWVKVSAGVQGGRDPGFSIAMRLEF